MKKKIIPLLLLFVASHVVHAVSVNDVDPAVMDRQETQPDTYMPPLVQNYFSFTVELLGMDYLYNINDKVAVPFDRMKKFHWSGLVCGSGAILYAIRLNQSRFAFCTGIGWSALYYVFASIEGTDNDSGEAYPRLKRESESRTTCKNLESKQGRVLLGSSVKIPFIDLLVRLRFNSVLDDPKAGFHTWLGFKCGFRQRASMMIDYKEYDDLRASSVDNGHFNLKPYTFAFQLGIGYSRFGLIGGFHVIPLFDKNQGPSNSHLLRPYSFGIYVNLL